MPNILCVKLCMHNFFFFQFQIYWEHKTISIGSLYLLNDTNIYTGETWASYCEGFCLCMIHTNGKISMKITEFGWRINIVYSSSVVLHIWDCMYTRYFPMAFFLYIFVTVWIRLYDVMNCQPYYILPKCTSDVSPVSKNINRMIFIVIKHVRNELFSSIR